MANMPGQFAGSASWDDVEDDANDHLDDFADEFDYLAPEGDGAHDSMGSPIHEPDGPGWGMMRGGPNANIGGSSPAPLDHPLDNALRELTGERVARRDLELDDVITLRDGSTETLRALVATGEVVRDVRSNLFRFANEPSPWSAGPPGQEGNREEAPTTDDGNDDASADKEDAAEYRGDPLPKEVEQELGTLAQHVPEPLQDVLATHLVNGIDLDASVVADFAASTGLDDTQAQAKIMELGQSFLDRASELMEAEGVPAGLVWAALRDGDGHEFSEVLHEYVQGNRDARPIKAAAQKVLSGLARNNPQELVNAELNSPEGVKARIVEKRKGDVYVAIAQQEQHADGKPITRERLIPWQTAVRQGIVRVRPRNPGKTGLRIKRD